MPCGGLGYQINQNPNSAEQNLVQDNCRKYKGFLPSFKPQLNSLSDITSNSGDYTIVYINGTNFLPSGTTYINFGSFKNIPVVYYSSFNISFVVPINALPGNYNVVAVNIYNDNFSPPVNISYGGKLNYSNSINYVIT